MTIDASIYSQLRPVEMPSMLDSAAKAANLSSMALQQKRGMKQMEREDKEAQMAQQQQRLSVLGGAVDALAGMPEPERAKAYGSVRAQVMQSGLFNPQDIPEEYDPGLFRQTASSVLPMYRQSKEYIERQKTMAEIANLERKASGDDDPLARQMAMLDARDQMEQRKKQRELQKYSQVGGWKLSEGATPTMDDAKKFKSGVSAARGLLVNLNEYQSLVEKYGSEVGGKVAQRMDSLARDIQLAAKNEDLYGLGVLTGPDLQILEDIISAPTGLGAKLDPMSGSRAANKTQQFREMLNSKINAKAKTFGFEPEAEWSQLAQGRRRGKDGDGFGPSARADEPTPEDMEAKHWLSRNPNDPDAPGVRARLQRKGLI
jgi:hypothetical protein